MEHAIILAHGVVTLRPLRLDDAAAFRAIVDADTWAGMSSPLPATDDAMLAHLRSLVDAPGTLAFAVEKRGRLVGRTALYDLIPGLKTDLGNTICARDVWGSEVNPAAKLLLIEYAFDELDVKRLALRCDHRNERSHNAIRRLGAQFEGTLRNFRPAADGPIADVDYFSVTPEERPAVVRGLRERLGI